MRHSILAIFAVFVATAACKPGKPTATAPESCTVNTQYTSTAGTGGNATLFPAIKFATAGRWQNPTLTTGVVQGNYQACAQSSSGALVGGEDCLFMNVWTPATVTQKMPVMVFIYGGAFVTGQIDALGNGKPAMYDGSALASRGVVVVTINYRLGIFGFLAAQIGSQTLNGNFGLLDQIAGLQWVQNNIAQFCGDSTNVTVFGESAGAMSTGLHAVNTLAQNSYKNLFQRAIMESNPIGARYKTRAEANAEAQKYIIPAMTKACGKQDLWTCVSNTTTTNTAALQAIETASTKAFQKDLTADIVADSGIGKLSIPLVDVLMYAPVVDSADPIFTTQPISGKFQVPAIMGTNADEGDLFAGMAKAQAGTPLLGPLYRGLLKTLFGSNEPTVEKQYPANLVDNYPTVGQVITDFAFLCGNRVAAGNQGTSASLYVYHYDYAVQYGSLFPNNPLCKVNTTVCHAAELPVVFQSPYSFGGTYYPQGFTSGSDQTTSNCMEQLWVSFATSGTPASNCNASSAWTAYGSAANYLAIDQTGNFSAATGYGSGSADNCDSLWKGIINGESAKPFVIKAKK